MRKCCQNVNIQSIVNHYKNKTTPICCARCIKLVEHLIKVENDYDINKFDIIIDNHNKLKLVLIKTNTVEQEMTDMVNSVETIFICINLNQDLSELSFNNNKTILIDKDYTDIRKTFVAELYNEQILTTKDIKYVIAHLNNDSMLKDKNLHKYDHIDVKTILGHYQAIRILKDYNLTEFQLEMQKSIEEPFNIN